MLRRSDRSLKGIKEGKGAWGRGQAMYSRGICPSNLHLICTSYLYLICATGWVKATIVEMGNIQRKLGLELVGLRYVECRILYWRCQMDKSVQKHVAQRKV